MSISQTQAIKYFDYLLSAKNIADIEVNKVKRFQQLKEKKIDKYNLVLESSNVNDFILKNKETLLSTIHDLHIKACQEDNEGKKSKYISLIRMLLSAIQKNKPAKDFCFMLETTPALQDMKLNFKVSGIDALELLITGYELEASVSSLKLSGDRVVESFTGIGKENKKVHRMVLKNSLNDLLRISLFYKNSKKYDYLVFDDFKDFIDSIKNDKIIRFDGKMRTLLLLMNNNVLYYKEFKLNDDQEIENFLEKKPSVEVHKPNNDDVPSAGSDSLSARNQMRLW